MNGREDEGETIVRSVVFVYLRGVLRSVVNISGRELFHKRPRRTVRGTVHSNILRKSGVIDSVTRIIRLISRLHHNVIEVDRFRKLDLDPFPGGRTVVMTMERGVVICCDDVNFLRTKISRPVIVRYDNSNILIFSIRNGAIRNQINKRSRFRCILERVNMRPSLSIIATDDVTNARS